MVSWKANKELKRSSQRDRSYLQKRVEAISKGGGKGGGKFFRKKLTLEEVKKRTRCKRCQQHGHWYKECTSPQNNFDTGFTEHFAGFSAAISQYDHLIFI